VSTPISKVGALEPFVMSRVGAWDGLRLTRPPLVPEVQLYIADDPIVLRARMEARAGRRMAPPFWASAWVGGQALARYLLDHADLVAGRRVLDVASGSGLVAIAAALAGAAQVTANDIDRYALAAVTMNARANNVPVTVRAGNLLDGHGEDAEVVLAGDVFYSPELAGPMLSFLDRTTARGARVLIGDPGRHHVPRHRLEVVTGYPVRAPGAPEDAQVRWVQVLRPGTDRRRPH
jgi:predicted nicotinamide N-methyase